MKRSLKWAAGALLTLLLAGASLAAHTWYFKPLSIDWFYGRAFLRLALENPELLTQLRILEPIGIRSPNARLTDASIAHEDRVIENTGMPEAEVVVEIERYLVMPAQALAYKIGMLKILELRERARSALGARFDIREFHDKVLKNGALPLALLERVIDAYVARRKAT